MICSENRRARIAANRYPGHIFIGSGAARMAACRLTPECLELSKTSGRDPAISRIRQSGRDLQDFLRLVVFAGELGTVQLNQSNQGTHPRPRRFESTGDPDSRSHRGSRRQSVTTFDFSTDLCRARGFGRPRDARLPDASDLPEELLRLTSASRTKLIVATSCAPSSVSQTQ
jgi:hypothetical protein